MSSERTMHDANPGLPVWLWSLCVRDSFPRLRLTVSSRLTSVTGEPSVAAACMHLPRELATRASQDKGMK